MNTQQKIPVYSPEIPKCREKETLRIFVYFHVSFCFLHEVPKTMGLLLTRCCVPACDVYWLSDYFRLYIVL